MYYITIYMNFLGPQVAVFVESQKTHAENLKRMKTATFLLYTFANLIREEYIYDEIPVHSEQGRPTKN